MAQKSRAGQEQSVRTQEFRYRAARREGYETMFRSTFLAAAAGAAILFGPQPTLAGDTPAPDNAYVYVGWPNDGEVIRSRRFKVWFGLRHIGVAPAGIKKPNTGHHHLIVDAPLPSFDDEVPNDRNHLHFGAGQTETIIELEPGQHTLQLLFADYDHIPHNPPIYSKRKTITVR